MVMFGHIKIYSGENTIDWRVWRCIWHCSVFQCIGLSRPDEALQHMMMAKELVPKFPAQVK